MRLKAAVIADDLTGALDSATPFALAGLRVAVAVRPSHLDEAMAGGAAVIAVNTATRSLAASEAAGIVRAVAERLKTAAPDVVFKKIDSRLKGNVRAEVEATARAFGLADIVVAPAVPDQGRFTAGAAVTGHGAPVPLPVAPVVPPHARIVDAAADADLDRLAAGTDWPATLAVGARGLGIALARRFGRIVPRSIPQDDRTLFVIGSADPVTASQVDCLAARADIHDVAGDSGGVTVGRLPAVLRGVGLADGPATVIARLASAARSAIAALAPAALVTSGGDTSLAVLDALGVGVVSPKGEASPGLPWFVVERAQHPDMICVVKSGGFGRPDTLAGLLPR